MFSSLPDARWWVIFDDVILTELIATALSGNLDIEIAEARVKEARAKADGVKGALQPQISAGGVAARDRTSAGAPGSFGEASRSTSFQLALESLWEVDLFGGNRRAFEAANANADALRSEVAATQVIVAAEIARAYVELRALQQQLLIAKSAVKNSQEILEMTERRFLAGSGHRAELNSARAELSVQRSLLPSIEGEIERTADRLAILAGKQPGAFSDLVKTIQPLPKPTRTPEIAFPATALRLRPDIITAENYLKASVAELDATSSELYPKLILPGSGGVLSGSRDTLLSSGNVFWSFTPTLSLNLFSGGRVRRAIEAAGARAEQARLVFDQTVLNALLEISDGLSLRRSALAQAVELRRAQSFARTAADELRQRYDLGAESIFTVLDAEAAVFESEDLALNAEADAVLALISLYKSTAGAPIDATFYNLQNVSDQTR